jgi:hypothetical protein
LRKEYKKTIDKFMPKKLLHLTVHDAAVHAMENSNSVIKNPNYNQNNMNGRNFLNNNVSRFPYQRTGYPIYMGLMNSGNIYRSRPPITKNFPQYNRPPALNFRREYITLIYLINILKLFYKFNIIT